MFENKKIFILGMARSGYESAKILAKHNCNVLITDMNEQNEEHVKELLKLGVQIEITKEPLNLLDETFDYVIKNPGIRLDHPICLKAKDLGIKVVSEVDVAYSLMKNVQIIGITGSNGKTTTTTLIYEFLKEHNSDVYLGGNIGFPVCSLVDKVNSFGKKAIYISNFNNIANYLKNHIHGDDIIITLGAGTITNLSKYLI